MQHRNATSEQEPEGLRKPLNLSRTLTADNIKAAFDSRRSADVGRELMASVGITVGGSAPWDIQVHDDRFYQRVFRDGNLGFGESYMDGWWDVASLDQMLDRVLRGRLDNAVRGNWIVLAQVVRARLLNLQTRRAYEVGEKHYDIGNDLYEAMLDKRMAYTCAYFKDTDDLDAAQEAKLDLVCRKIGARPGMRILELGCGWGSFARFAAERYGASVVGCTVSKEQVALAKERCVGLPVDIRLDDYRNARGSYDAVVSIGLMEHVGFKNYRTYMKVVDRCLAPGGVAFVHTIAGNKTTVQTDTWFDKYIFPNAVVPTMGVLGTAMEELMVPEDLHNIGPHYDRTLMAWWERFDAAWPELKGRYSDRFYRMWKYYLLSSAASFRARYLNLYQMVMTRIGTPQPNCRVS
jgi:cyclopropane-fatty-acyl-phospholipid synthase